MKMIKVFLLIFALINTTYAAKITDPVLHVGKQAGNDFTILHKDGGYIKKAGSQGDWFFSKDGVLEKKIGSGTGGSGDGGVNILANNSFEDGLTDWTTSGGTLTQQTYTNSIESNTKYARFVSTTPGEYVESSCIARPDNFTYGGMADIRYLGGSGNFELKVFDCSSGDTEISSSTLADLTEWNKSPTQTFTAPANLKIRIISTGAGTIDFDLAYGGSDKNFGPASGGRELAFEAYYPITTGCQWSVTGTGGYLSFADFPVDTDCAAPIARVEKNGMTLDTTDADLPQFTINNMPPGKYEIEVTGLTIVGLQLQEIGIALFENTTATDFYKDAYVSRNSSASENEQFTFNTEFTNPSLATRVFKLRGGNGSGGVVLNVDSGQGRELQVKIYRLTGEVVDAFTPEQADFYIESIIGGDGGNASITMPTGTPSEASASNLIMENIFGSSKIPCSSTNVPTGLTCTSGNEVPGIVFNAPLAGRYEVCGTLDINGSNGSHQYSINHVQNNTSTIIKESRVFDKYTSNSNMNVREMVNGCEIFDLPIGENTFKVFSVKTGGVGNIEFLNIPNKGLGNLERFGRFRVKLLSNFVARPIIQNMVDTTVASGQRIESCDITNPSGTPSIQDDSGMCGFVSGVVNGGGTGNIVWTLESVFKNEPNCVCSARIADGDYNCVADVTSPTSVRTVTKLPGGSLLNGAVTLICTGAR